MPDETILSGKSKTPFPKTPSLETVDNLWRGSVDMHIHVPIEIGVNRRYTAYQTAEIAQKAGMKAIVLKNHNSSTALTAFTIQSCFPDLEVVGSLCIEYGTTAGLNKYTAEIVENQAKIGAKVLWFPTFDAYWHRNFVPQLKGTGIKVVDENGKLNQYIPDILQVVKDYNLVLGTGHISYSEAKMLLEAASAMGITRIVATHPMSETSRTPYALEEMKQLVSLGAYIEHCWRNCLPQLNSYDPHRYVDAIRELGAEHCILSTDFAQVSDPSPAEGLRSFIAVMLQFGLYAEEVEIMVKSNPYKLLDINSR